MCSITSNGTDKYSPSGILQEALQTSVRVQMGQCDAVVV
jgi:hypothetical protein